MPKAFFNIGFTASTPPVKLHGNDRAEYVARRKFYDLTAEYNYFSYTLNGKKCAKNKSAEEYFEKSGTGLFGLNGEYTEAEKEALKKRLSATKSIIWHGFVSFDAATSLGFTSTEQAQKFLRQTFGALLDRTHLRQDNIELYASLHTDRKHHHHIHFAFFEKEAKRLDKNGVLGYTKIGTISPKAIDNYLVSANMHLDEHGAEYYTARDNAMDRLREVRGAVMSGVQRDMRLNIALDRLTGKLPKTGRLQYNSENMAAFRPEIDRVAQLLISSDPKARELHEKMLAQLARVERNVRELAAENKLAYINGRRLGKAEMEQAIDGTGKLKPQYVDMQNVDYFKRLKSDYDARLGNTVLGMCKEIKRGGYLERRSRLKVNDKSAKVASRRNSAFRAQLLKNVLTALGSRSGRADYQLTVREIENQMQYDRGTTRA